MRSKSIPAILMFLMPFCVMPPAIAADEPVPEDEHAGLEKFEQFYAAAARGNPSSSTTNPKDGGLFELPVIGSLDSVGIRYASARQNFDGMSQQALFANFRTPWAWSTWGNTTTSLKFSFEAGRFARVSENRYFVSLGPNLRLENDAWKVPLFFDLNVSPTVIGGSTYGDDDLGTSLNFSSYIGLGIKLGRTKRHELRLRYQHISNGGIDDTNPGVNMVGLDFVFWGRRR